MKYYELTYLISSDISEEEAKDLQERVTAILQEEGGVLDERWNPIKRQLAYPIKKHLQAYLAFLTFQLAPEKLAGLQAKIEGEKEIIRYLLITKIKTEKVTAPRRRRKPEAVPVVPITPKVIEKLTEEKKVELKEIDKKLEEILEK